MNAQAYTHAQALETLANHTASATGDIQCVIDPENKKYGWSVHAHALALELGAPVETCFKAPQKQVKRFAQMINCILLGTAGVKQLDYTHTRALIAMRAAGSYDLTRDAVAALAANRIMPGIETRGVTRAQVNTLFARAHGLSTVQTKISNSVGERGYMTLCGMTSREGHTNSKFHLNIDSAIVRGFFSIVYRAT